MPSESASLCTPPRPRGFVEGYNAEATRQHAEDNSNSERFEGFFDKYLQEEVVDSTEAWEKFKEQKMKEINEAKIENPIYEPLAALLNWISCYCYRRVHDPSAVAAPRCITFCDTNDEAPKGLRYCKIRPDLTATPAKYETTESYVASPPEKKEKTRLHWHNIITFAEVKKGVITVEDRYQASGYASRLPEGRPEVAGMLYLVACKYDFMICWSDASRVIRSPTVSWDDAKGFEYLFRYVRTLYQPMPGLIQIDDTITLDENRVDDPRGPQWRIETRSDGSVYHGTRLRSTPAYGRQTFVWNATKDGDTTGRRYIIKDCWRGTNRRFREAELYTKALGVRGIAQIHSGDKVEGKIADGSYKQLRTSQIHSGEKHETQTGATERQKERIVMISTGDPLRKRTSVSQLLKAAYDVVQTHQVLVKEKGVLHRDISPNNILINPVHDEACEFQESESTKYIEQVLEPENPNIQVKGMVIDLDNGADMKNKAELAKDSVRTGTRKYIARTVAKGRHDKSSTIDGLLHFPVLDGTALQLYTRAYGEETYKEYITKFNECPSAKLRPPEMCDFEHRPHHDMESVIWILFDTLTRAMPKGAKDMALTWRANQVIRNFDTHMIGSVSDTRFPIMDLDGEEWKDILHPGLSFLAESLAHLSLFLKTDWSLWKKELPQDFMHEALKRILLREIIHIKEHNIDDKLSVTERSPPEMLMLTGADLTPKKRGSNSQASGSTKRLRRK